MNPSGLRRVRSGQRGIALSIHEFVSLLSVGAFLLRMEESEGLLDAAEGLDLRPWTLVGNRSRRVLALPAPSAFRRRHRVGDPVQIREQGLRLLRLERG